MFGYRRYVLDEDQQEQLFQVKLCIAAVVAFIVSTYLSWVELRYLAFSRPAQGEITRAYLKELPSRRGMKRSWEVEFSFADEAGGPQTGRQSFAVGSPLRTGEAVTVRYFSGPHPQPRIAGTGKVWPVVVFAGSILLGGYAIWSLAQEANRPFQVDRRGRKYGLHASR